MSETDKYFGVSNPLSGEDEAMQCWKIFSRDYFIPNDGDFNLRVL